MVVYKNINERKLYQEANCIFREILRVCNKIMQADVRSSIRLVYDNSMYDFETTKFREMHEITENCHT